MSSGRHPCCLSAPTMSTASIHRLSGSHRATLQSTVRCRSRARNAATAWRSGRISASIGRPLGMTSGFTPHLCISCFM
jgi:hypothetical protein